MTRHMLTTVDNPFNPFTHFDDWYNWDVQAGYHTSSFLARIMLTSSDLSDSEQDAAYEAAVDEIVRENVLGMWRKVEEPSSSSPPTTPASSAA
jgi:hypothetical protein